MARRKIRAPLASYEFSASAWVKWLFVLAVPLIAAAIFMILLSASEDVKASHSGTQSIYNRQNRHAYHNNQQMSGLVAVFAPRSGAATADAALPGLRSSSNAANTNTFVKMMSDRLNGSDEQDRIGAALMINTMLGVNGSQFTGRTAGINHAKDNFADWEDRLRWASQEGCISWNLSRTFGGGGSSWWNSAYSTGNDHPDAGFFRDTKEDTQLTIVIRDPSTPGASCGGVIFEVRKNCGNPAGILTSLPKPPSQGRIIGEKVAMSPAGGITRIGNFTNDRVTATASGGYNSNSQSQTFSFVNVPVGNANVRVTDINHPTYPNEDRPTTWVLAGYTKCEGSNCNPPSGSSANYPGHPYLFDNWTTVDYGQNVSISVSADRTSSIVFYYKPSEADDPEPNWIDICSIDIDTTPHQRVPGAEFRVETGTPDNWTDRGTRTTSGPEAKYRLESKTAYYRLTQEKMPSGYRFAGWVIYEDGAILIQDTITVNAATYNHTLICIRMRSEPDFNMRASLDGVSGNVEPGHHDLIVRPRNFSPYRGTEDYTINVRVNASGATQYISNFEVLTDGFSSSSNAQSTNPRWSWVYNGSSNSHFMEAGSSMGGISDRDAVAGRFRVSDNINAHGEEVCFVAVVSPRQIGGGTYTSEERCITIQIPRQPYLDTAGHNVHAGMQLMDFNTDTGRFEQCSFDRNPLDASYIRGRTGGSPIRGSKSQYVTSASDLIRQFGSGGFPHGQALTFGNVAGDVNPPGRYGNVCAQHLADYYLKSGNYIGSTNSTNTFNNLNYPSGVYRWTPSSIAGFSTGFTLSPTQGRRFTLVKEGNLAISGNIIIYPDDPYSSGRRDIPAFSIIATGDINISRHVTRLDGVYMAGGTINTCWNSPIHINADGCSNRLEVNGSLIASGYQFKRTPDDVRGLDGAAREPAEMIRFRPETYLAPPPGILNPQQFPRFMGERPPVF